MRRLFLGLTTLLFPFFGICQLNDRANEIQLNTITTAVPFLQISGNALQMGLADIGVVSNNYYTQTAFTSNAALLANGHKYAEAMTSYTPWLRTLVPDINLFTHSMAATINEHHALGLYFKNFSLGNIQFTDQNGNFIRDFNPSEQVLQLNYATWFKSGISAGIGVKYIYSNLTGGINVGGADTKPGQSFAIDLGFNYRGHKQLVEGIGMGYSIGLGINNIGSKMTYTSTNERDFIPTNMQLGVMFGPSFEIGRFRLDLDFAYQVSKLLVPTPPVYATDSAGASYALDADGERIILAGKDPNVGVLAGMFQSFSDAPGGSSEEFNEVNHHVSSELRFVFNHNVSIHFRKGFFYEHATKGNRQFITVGLGATIYGFRFDMAYLIPTQSQHPLANTLSFSLGYRLRLGKLEKYRLPTWNPITEQLQNFEAEVDSK